LEAIGKQALALLRENINSKLNDSDVTWDALDPMFGYRTIQVERIPPDNFYYGHRPSLIDAPIERYPNCSVMAYQAQPAPEGDLLDHQNVYTVSLFVELMCKSDSDEGEVNSRISRTADAAHAVFMQFPTLSGLVSEIGNAPTIILTDVFARPEHDGQKFVWQGARLEYRINKYANR
jgi:hypothetical protein